MNKPTITDLEIIDAVILHAAKQKCKSGTKNYGCRYREGDLKCFAGIFIEDDLYNEKFEGLDIREVNDDVFTYDFTRDQVELLRRLQSIHDTYEVYQWGKKLEILRNEYAIPTNIQEAIETLKNISGEDNAVSVFLL